MTTEPVPVLTSRHAGAPQIRPIRASSYSLALQRALSDIATQTGEAGAQGVFQAEATRLLGHGVTHAHDPYVAPDWHQQMLTLRAQGPLRLSWATGAPAGMEVRPPGPGFAPAGPYGDSGREVKVFVDGGDRCALRLPKRAAAGLLASSAGEAWRLRAAGPLREALRRKVSVRDGHLETPYLRYTDTELANLVSEYVEAGCGCVCTRLPTSPAPRPLGCSGASPCRPVPPPSIT